MSDAPMGFGPALLKREGGRYIWDTLLGNYREMTPDEIRKADADAAEWEAYLKTPLGRLHQLGLNIKRWVTGRNRGL